MFIFGFLFFSIMSYMNIIVCNGLRLSIAACTWTVHVAALSQCQGVNGSSKLIRGRTKSLFNFGLNVSIPIQIKWKTLEFLSRVLLLSSPYALTSSEPSEDFPYALAAVEKRQAHVYEMRMNGNISHSVHSRTTSDKLTNSFLFNFFVYFRKFLEQHIKCILLFQSSDYDKCMSLISLICTYAKNFHQTTIEMSGVAEITKGKCLSNKSNQIFHSWKSLIKKSRQDINSMGLLLFLLSRHRLSWARDTKIVIYLPTNWVLVPYVRHISDKIWGMRGDAVFVVLRLNMKLRRFVKWTSSGCVYWEIEMSASFLRRHLLLMK